MIYTIRQFCFNLKIAFKCNSKIDERNVSVPLLSVETVLGMMTNLPCNITPSVPGDQVLIVLWYKDGYGKPIYSFDLRHEAGGEEDGGKLWARSDSGDDIPRAQLNVNSHPTAFLALFGVKEKDGGTYRCRVDFKKSPTRFWKVELTVIGRLALLSGKHRGLCRHNPLNHPLTILIRG